MKKFVPIILTCALLLTGCNTNDVKTQSYQQGLKVISINMDTENGKYDFADVDNTIVFSIDGVGYCTGYFVDAGLYDQVAEVVSIDLPNGNAAMPGELGTIEEYNGSNTFNYCYIRQMSSTSGLPEYDYIIDFGDSNFILSTSMDEAVLQDIFSHIHFKIEQEIIINVPETLYFEDVSDEYA